MYDKSIKVKERNKCKEFNKNFECCEFFLKIQLSFEVVKEFRYQMISFTNGLAKNQYDYEIKLF